MRSHAWTHATSRLGSSTACSNFSLHWPRPGRVTTRSSRDRREDRTEGHEGNVQDHLARLSQNRLCEVLRCAVHHSRGDVTELREARVSRISCSPRLCPTTDVDIEPRKLAEATAEADRDAQDDEHCVRVVNKDNPERVVSVTYDNTHERPALSYRASRLQARANQPTFSQCTDPAPLPMPRIQAR